jgi:uracil-DNA glycosylase family 4
MRTDSELENFDWFGHKSPSQAPKYKKPIPLSIIAANSETLFERKMRMLISLSQTCISCSMCELGTEVAMRDHIGRDPHVFSNLNPTQFIIADLNPKWAELEKFEPFVGESGRVFDNEISKWGIKRKDFYICNIVRCYVSENKNSSPTAEHIKKCESFFHMEINIIRPKLIVALGPVVFHQLCSAVSFVGSLKKITKSERFKIPVFAVYHPSQLDFSNSEHRLIFEDQIKVLCALICAINSKHSNSSVG